MRYQLRDIEYFSEIAERGNVARAAEALGLSQPALSKSLRRLEASMQTKLVKRLSKGVELTAAGRELYTHVHRLRLSLNDIAQAVTDIGQGDAGHLRIASGTGLAVYVVAAACADLIRNAPNLTFKLSVMERAAAEAALRHGDLDLSVMTLQAPIPKDLVAQHLYQETFVVCAAAGHRLARKKRLTLADLVGEKWIVSGEEGNAPRHLKQTFIDAGLPPPRISVETATMALRLMLLGSSELLSIANPHIVRYAEKQLGLVELPIREFNYTRSFGIYHRKDAYLSPAAKRIIDLLKKNTAKMAIR